MQLIDIQLPLSPVAIFILLAMGYSVTAMLRINYSGPRHQAHHRSIHCLHVKDVSCIAPVELIVGQAM